MQKSNPPYDWIFESSWEVCNKIGGIYTVLSTKAKALAAVSGGNLIFVGPDVWTEENPCPVFKEYPTVFNRASIRLKLPYGIKVRTGRWLVPGNPYAILVDCGDVEAHLPDIYARMWELYGVDSLHAYGDYGEGCAFGVASAIVINAMVKQVKADPRRVIAHFDEWTTAMGLLWLEDKNPDIATVFTTHATSIGRSICSNGKPLYDYFDGYHGDQMARELNMESKHSLEKTAARRADCFTTVSRVTARECAKLLEVEPQVVTPNGFENDFVPKNREYTMARSVSRRKLLALASALTGRPIDNNALLVATSGRNEYRNKGIDLYIDAMDLVRSQHAGQDIVAFIMVPAWSDQPQPGLRERMSGRPGTSPELNFVSHRLYNEDSDPIFQRLSQLGGNNNPDTNVLYVYVPCYLDGRDGVLNMTYYDMMPGLDLTVFPSYYEPWGYTPLESIAFSVPTISTDKAGFGQWIMDDFDATFTGCGAEVVERNDSNYDAAKYEIAQKVRFMVMNDEREKSKIRTVSHRTAAWAAWKRFIKHYDTAYETALQRRDERVGPLAEAAQETSVD